MTCNRSCGRPEPGQPPDRASAARTRGQSAGPAIRVLIIDDRRDSSFPMQKLLELEGHQVQAAADGAGGIELARRFQPQLVLCDINLAGEPTGYGVAAALRADPSLRSAYLVAVTGYGGNADRQRADEAGFDCYRTKPIGQAELLALVDLLRCRNEAAKPP